MCRFSRQVKYGHEKKAALTEKGQSRKSRPPLSRGHQEGGRGDLALAIAMPPVRTRFPQRLRQQEICGWDKLNRTQVPSAQKQRNVQTEGRQARDGRQSGTASRKR